jgi:general secretion pathway protein K
LALATLASVATMYVAQSAVALTVMDEAMQTEPLVTASLELTAYQLSSPAEDKRPTRGAFRFRLSRADVAVEFVSEAARIDLNTAPKALIAGLFAAVGVQPEAAYRYADRVVGWRAPPKQGARDNEETLYLAAGLQYAPRGAPYNHVDELWLVLDLPAEVIERVLPFVTIYSGRSDVNVLDAAPEVIAALPNMSSGRLNAFLNQRETLPQDPDFVAGALGDKQPGANKKGSGAYRVRTLMVFDNGRRKMSEVVIAINGNGNEPYRVLSWKDDIDAATGAPRTGGR